MARMTRMGRTAETHVHRCRAGESAGEQAAVTETKLLHLDFTSVSPGVFSLSIESAWWFLYVLLDPRTFGIPV